MNGFVVTDVASWIRLNCQQHHIFVGKLDQYNIHPYHFMHQRGKRPLWISGYAKRLRDMKCAVHALEAMGSTPCQFELGMCSTFV